MLDIVEVTPPLPADLCYFSTSLTSILASTSLQALWTDGGPITPNSTRNISNYNGYIVSTITQKL